jgi:hypothetical protein
MAESNIVKVKRDGTISLLDGTSPSPLSYVISAEPGDFNISVPAEVKNDFLDRGRLVGSVRYGDDQAVTGSFSVYYRGGLSVDGAAAALLDILNGTAFSYAASPWISTLGASAEVKTVDLVFTVEGTDFGDAADHVCTIEDCSIESYSIAEGDPNTISITFRSHTAVRPIFS